MRRHLARLSGQLLRWLGICLLGLSSAPATAQQAGFDVEPFTIRHNDGRVRLDLFLRVPLNQLSFIRQGRGFQARYEVGVELYALNGRGQPQGLLESRLQERTLTVSSYEQTQQEAAYDYLQLMLFPSPGRYAVQVRLEDRHTGQQQLRQLEVTVPDLASLAFAASDLLVLDRFDEAQQVLYPNVVGEIGHDQEEFLVFFELYTRWPRRVQLRYELVRPRPPVRPTVRGLLGRQPPSEPEVGFQNIETRLLSPIRNQFVVRIPLRDLRPDRYLIRLIVRDETGQELLRREKPLRIRWTGLAAFIADLDQAIAQVYIAKPAEIRFIQEAPTQTERLDRFRAFWKKRDPTPGTERNELMEEYYQRVWYANRQFSGPQPGWKTDRGMVYILFGQPDAIDHHPFEYNAKPYQIWYYYSLNRRFIFVDQSGFGDYRLLTPIWDELNTRAF